MSGERSSDHEESLENRSLACGYAAVGHPSLRAPLSSGKPPTNCAPPTGAILDLDGTPIPHTYTEYSVNFTATATTTNVSFAFREDPAFLFLDDVTVRLGVGRTCS